MAVHFALPPVLFHPSNYSNNNKFRGNLLLAAEMKFHLCPEEARHKPQHRHPPCPCWRSSWGAPAAPRGQGSRSWGGFSGPLPSFPSFFPSPRVKSKNSPAPPLMQNPAHLAAQSGSHLVCTEIRFIKALLSLSLFPLSPQHNKRGFSCSPHPVLL